LLLKVGDTVKAKLRTVNAQTLLEILSCWGFSATIIYSVVSGKYLNYVAPRVAPYLWFAVAVLVLWSALRIPAVFSPRHRKRVAHCAVLIVLSLLVLAPSRPIAAASVSYRRTPLASAAKSRIASLSGGAREKTTAPSPAAPERTAADSPAAQSPEPSDTIFITSGDWYTQISAIQDYPGAYDGRAVDLTGFIYRESDVIIARLAMSCCVADVIVSGLPIEYDGAESLQNDDWYRVIGIVETDSEGLARISVSSITPADEIYGYVYTQ
jgi:putative membrane protein